MGVMRLGYVHLRVTDVTDARAHYVGTLGMQEIADHDGKVYLKAWDEYDHHSLVLEESGVGLVKLGYKVEHNTDLDYFEKKAATFGASTERMSAGDNLAVGDGLRITLPSQHVVELYHEVEQLGKMVGDLNPEAWPRHLHGLAVPSIDHALIGAADPAMVERFFMEVMDFKPAERVVSHLGDDGQLIGSWLFANQKAHDIAVIQHEDAALHHFAYKLTDWSDILKAGDIFSMDDVPVDIGPTRHGITRGTTIYFFDPSGNRNEVFAGGYSTDRDFPTITWTADQLGKGIFYITRELNERFTTVFT